MAESTASDPEPAKKNRLMPSGVTLASSADNSATVSVTRPKKPW